MDRTRGAAQVALEFSRRNGLFFALIALFVYFSVASLHFYTADNLRVILLNISITGLVAVPAAMLVLCGYVDLSVGSTAVLAAVIFGKLFEAGVPPLPAMLITLLCGALWGLLQAYLVCYLNLSPIVVTLGGLAGLRGLALYISDAFVVQGFGPQVEWLGNGSWLEIRTPTWIFLGTFLIGGYLWFVTPLGRHMTAVGADPVSAHAMGVNVRRIPLLLYVASGVAGALGGLILMSQLDASSMSIGTGWELTVLTAVLLGGISFTGGRGSLFGVLIGVLFIGVLQNGLLQVNVSSYLSQVAVGAALAFAAAMDRIYQRLDRVVIRGAPDQGDEVAVSAAGSPPDAPRPEPGVPVAEAAGPEPPLTRGPVLEIQSIAKSFGAVQAVREVSFELRRGEVVALVGDNGAGKSTLINVISGVLPADRGEIVLDGVAHAFDSPAQARAAGIETVFQNLALIPTLDIAENIFLRREAFRGGAVGRAVRWMDRAAMRREVAQGFARLGLTLPAPRTKVGALSGGQRQAVAIARPVLWGSRIVLLDEPAAALGVHQTEIVLRFVERLKAHGVGVIVISHNMEHVMRVADRVIVMRLGQKVFDGPAASVTMDDVVALITGSRTAPPADRERVLAGEAERVD